MAAQTIHMVLEIRLIDSSCCVIQCWIPVFTLSTLQLSGPRRTGEGGGWEVKSHMVRAMDCYLLISSSTIHPQELAFGIELNTRSIFSHTLIKNYEIRNAFCWY